MDLSQAMLSTSDGPSKTGFHSVEGFGKTTLACHFPNPLIVGAERGIPRDLGFQVATLHPNSWLGYFDIIGGLTNDRHAYQTLVIDTVDWVEPFIHRFVLARDSGRQTEMNPKSRELVSIEDYGYGKGYLVAEEEFRKLISAIDVMQAKRGIHVVMLMHSTTKTYKNPAGPDFDRWEPKCQSRIARVIVEWVENLMFGFFQIDAAKISADKERNEKTARAKGIGAGLRTIGARQCAMYDAKNRVGLPPEFEFGEDLTALVSSLLGENVATHGRRAALREVSGGEAWADRQARVAGEQARTAARDQADRAVEPPEFQTSAGGPPESDRERQDRERREAREWKEPTAAANQDPTPTRGPGNGPPYSGNAPTPGSTRQTENLEQNRLIGDLTDALSRARQRDPKYGKEVDGWIAKANSDPKKLQAIIARVNKDLGSNVNSQPAR